jgi:hypothetical protein
MLKANTVDVQSFNIFKEWLKDGAIDDLLLRSWATPYIMAACGGPARYMKPLSSSAEKQHLGCIISSSREGTKLEG